MIQVTDQLLDEIARVIVDEVSPEQVILFGSHATDTTGPDSDVDLLVIASAPFGQGRSRLKEFVRLKHALMPFAVPIDVILYSREEVEGWRDSLNHVVARALREGKVLYERP